MYHFMQRNKKKLLAIFGVMLMVVFILPSGFKNQNDPTTITVGTVGDEKITYGEVEQARRDLGTMMRAGFRPLINLGETPESRFRGQVGRIGSALSQKPEAYVLLQREAKAAGIRPSQEDIDSTFNNSFASRVASADDVEAYKGMIDRFLLVNGMYQRVVGQLKVTTPLLRSQIAPAQLATLNIVEFTAAEALATTAAPTTQQVIANYDQYATVVAPTESTPSPTTQPVKYGYQLSDRVKLQYLVLTQDSLATAIATTFTPEEQYDLDMIAASFYAANQTQFEAPPPATQPTEPPSDSSTQPTTLPSTNPATMPASMPVMLPATKPVAKPATAPATKPVIKPFASVKAEIRRRLLTGDITPAELSQDATTKLQGFQKKFNIQAEDLRQKLRDRLAADYRAQRGKPTTASATQPATQPAAPSLPIDAPGYLETVAAEFEKSTGVHVKLDVIASTWFEQLVRKTTGPAAPSLLADVWHSRADLENADGIGSSFAIDGRFAEVATQHAPEETPAVPLTLGPAMPATAPTSTPTTAPSTQPTTTPTGPATSPSTKPARSALAVLQPSPLLKDTSNNAYLFRLTAFDGGRTPSFDEARPKIEENLKLAAAYDNARINAQKFRDASAPASANAANLTGGVPLNAELLGKKVYVAGPIGPGAPPELAGYALPSDPITRQIFQMGVRNLLSKATADQPHPSTVIELAGQKKVLVVELRSVERYWTADQDYINQQGIAENILNEQMPLTLSWFDPAGIIARTKFNPVKKG